ncbi:MAG: TIGR03016 family PEP-CTERM system-associated outer membrane protein [Gammaproteobacteria bacterium]
MAPKNNNKIGVFLALLLVLGTTTAVQAQWEYEPSIYTGVLWTDNLGLQPDGNQRDDLSYEVRPSLLLTHRGPRFTLDSNYILQARRFQENDENDQVFHNLNFRSGWIALADQGNQVGVDFLSNIQQQIVDLQLGIGGTTATRVGNQSDIATYSIEPYWNFSAGSSVTGRVAYRIGLNEFDQPQLLDSKNNNITISAATDPDRGRWSLGGSFTSSTIEYDTGREVTLARTSVDFGYDVTPRTEFVLSVGSDDNDLGNLPFLGDIDGAFWLAGFKGQLGGNTRYEARVGEQFFGSSYLLSLDRTQGRLTFSVSYSEQASTFGGAQLDFQAILGLLPNIDATGVDLPNTTQDVFISKRLNFGMGYTLPKSTFQLNVFSDDRTFLSSLDGDREDRGSGANLTWNWQMSQTSSFTLIGNFRSFVIRNTGDEPKDILFEARWRRDLFERAYMDLRVIHNQRQSNIEQFDFQENTVAVGVGYRF